MDALTIIAGLALLAIVSYVVYSFAKSKRVDTSVVINIADVAVRYVEQVYKLDSNEKKKQFAEDRVISALKAMGIKIDGSVISMIDLAIEGAVQKLPKTN